MMMSEPPRKSLIDFPSEFPIKVLGPSHDEFAATIVALLQQFDAGFDQSRVETRPSSGGKYTGLTCSVWTTSQEHLDDIYRALTSHPMVKVVL
jgi:putative lipoic acid-binding regulatory protein